MLILRAIALDTDHLESGSDASMYYLCDPVIVNDSASLIGLL